MEELAILRLRDGKFYTGRSGPLSASWSDVPRFFPLTPSRAEAVARVDLGMDLKDVRVMTRQEVAAMRPEDRVFGGRG